MATISTTKLFPDQSRLSDEEYLALTDGTSRLVELVDGRIEELPMPTMEHQRILLFLYSLVKAFVGPNKLGEVLVAALRTRVAHRHYREPDVLFMLEKNAARKGNRYWDGADLVMEVVSADDPKRDYIDKRRAYATAGISEYWIVDPMKQTILVLRLDRDQYVVHCEATGTGRVNSALLPGFAVETAEVFAAGRNG
jgi:Uma2 family endonuclease